MQRGLPPVEPSIVRSLHGWVLVAAHAVVLGLMLPVAHFLAYQTLGVVLGAGFVAPG